MSSNYDAEFHDDDNGRDTTFDKPDSGLDPASILAQVKETVQKPVEEEDLKLVIPARPKLRGIYSTHIDGDQFQQWQRKCTRKGSDTLDQTRLAATIVANQFKGLELFVKGTWIEAKDKNGEALSFQSDEFKEIILNGDLYTSATILARRLLGSDGVLTTVASQIAEAAGYTANAEDLYAEDPTKG